MYDLLNQMLELQIGLNELGKLRSADPQTLILIEEKLEELERKADDLKAKLFSNKLASNQ